jgi:hypothetical protein
MLPVPFMCSKAYISGQGLPGNETPLEMKQLMLTTICFLLSYCNLQAQFSTTDFTKLNGLKGVWGMPVKNGVLYEQWVIESDSVMKGNSYKTAGTDTILLEKVTLHFNNGMITYTSVAANQNNNQPVDFKLVAIKKDQYIFENKAHDFPQQITYKLVGTDSLFASINGTTKNGFKEIEYPYKKEANR